MLLSSPLISEGPWFLKALPPYWYPLGRVSFLSSHLILGMQAFGNYHLRPDLSARRHLELQLSARLCSSISNCSPQTGLCHCSAVPGCSRQIRTTWSSGVEDTRGMASPCFATSSAQLSCQHWACSLCDHILHRHPAFPHLLFVLGLLLFLNQPFGSCHAPQAASVHCGLPQGYSSKHFLVFFP